MRYQSVDSIKSGDILAKPILTLDGVVLLGEGTVLSPDYVSRIKLSGINNIYVYENIYETNDSQQLDFSEIKNKGIKIVSNIYQKVVNYQSIQIDEITPVVEDILKYIRSGSTFPTHLIQSIKLKDDSTYIHSLNTCFLSVLLGEYLKLDEEQLVILGTGALLHDIGKIRIHDGILKKPGKLTDGEYSEMKRHTVYGYEILKKIKNMNKECALIALNHHERFDGTGYPSGLKHDAINFFSQIVSVADVYDALVNIRSYKKGQKPNEAFEFILSKTGTFFNIIIVKAFRDCILIYPDGVGIKLSDGSIGYVTKQNPGFPERPVVKVVTNSVGEFISPYEIDLMKYLNIIIDDILL